MPVGAPAVVGNGHQVRRAEHDQLETRGESGGKDTRENDNGQKTEPRDPRLVDPDQYGAATQRHYLQPGHILKQCGHFYAGTNPIFRTMLSSPRPYFTYES